MKKQNFKIKVRSALRWFGLVLLVQFILINISASLYAHKYSHFYNDPTVSTNFSNENVFQKTWRLITGPKFSKSVIYETPTFPFETIDLSTKKGVKIEAWYAKADSAAIGTVILFHGLSQSKATKLSEAYEFRYNGYNVMMVDFRAHGNSEGNKTTVGYRESEEVKLAFDYAIENGDRTIFLWGTSMGAVAITKAVADYDIKPTGVILEMPFASMQSHIGARVRSNGFSGFPEKPFAFLVTFWTGIERGYSAFKFKTNTYTAKVTCPVLLQWGAKDNMVLKYETDKIFSAIASPNKKLVIYENADHESFLENDPIKWRLSVEKFLRSNSK